MSKVYNETWALDHECPVCKGGRFVRVTIDLIAPSADVVQQRKVHEVVSDVVADYYDDMRFICAEYADGV